MKAPIAPPPAKPDSVELLRKRTGTPRIGVPIMPAPESASAGQPRATLAGQPVAPPVTPPVLSAQAPVAGVIDPGTPASSAEAASRSGRVSIVVQDGTAEPAARTRDAETVLPPAAPEASQPRGKRPRPASAELRISQVWYDEGEQLSDSDDRATRARRTISPSTVDVMYDDEPPRRRWGLIAGLGTFAVIGGIMVFALARGGSSNVPGPAAQPAQSATAAPQPAVAAPAASEPPASEVIATAGSSSAKPAGKTTPSPVTTAPPPAPRRAETRTASDLHAAAPPPARRSEPSMPVLGSEPIRKPPSLGTVVASPAPLPSTAAAKAPSLTDMPKDPYGSDEPPADGVAPEKKAEFFANLGAQQLIGGDMAGAAASFKKALELDNKSIAATLGMGEIALRQGLFGDAIAHLSKATKLAPRNARALTLLGDAYLSSGNNAQAATQFKKALQIDPDNARARDGYNEASSRVPPPSDDAQ